MSPDLRQQPPAPGLDVPVAAPPPYSPHPPPPNAGGEQSLIELRTLARPASVHLRDPPGDEANALPPSYTPPPKIDLEPGIYYTVRPRKRRTILCTKKCCVILFFILIICVGMPVGYVMAKKAKARELSERRAHGLTAPKG